LTNDENFSPAVSSYVLVSGDLHVDANEKKKREDRCRYLMTGPLLTDLKREVHFEAQFSSTDLAESFY
jgi:hypothetical protein